MPTVLADQLTRTLPPLILHPFSDASGPGKLVESSRASLMLQGLLPSGELTAEQLESRLVDGRYCEIRMLFYVGKDLVRWVEQCLEFASRHLELRNRHYTYQSFISYLIFKTPAPVQAKLRKWGVADYRSIFSRAIALNTLFTSIPEPVGLSDEFVKNYYRYTDAIFKANLHETTEELNAEDFDFDLFASGEYSRMLELEWSRDTEE
jgi:hypothetical protein